MRNVAGNVVRFAVAACVVVLGAAGAHAMCCPIPCDGCWIESAGQLNLVVMDRSAGQIQLVPNIRILGQAQDFALVVPTPSVPDFDLAPTTVWQELTTLTAPVPSQDGDDGCGGVSQSVATTGPGPEFGDAAVGVIVQETVGAFQVTVLESNDPTALLNWLVEHEFPLDLADAALFGPYIERGWVFTAMKLDPERAQMPIGGWNTNVEPVRMTYEATEFELALPLMSINRAAWMPVAVYVVDDNRMDLEGFETLYANRITRNEHRAIIAGHPGMADFIKPDRWLTRLDRTFDSDDAMEVSLYLERARSNTEFRRVFRTRGSLSLGMLLLVLGLTGHKIRRHMRNTTT